MKLLPQSWYALYCALRSGLACSLLLLAVLLGLQAMQLLAQLAEVAGRTEARMDTALAELRAQNRQLMMLEAQAAGSLKLAGEEIARARRDLDENSQALLAIMHSHLVYANRSLAQTGWSLSAAAASAADSINQVTGQAAQIESQVSEALELSLDCDHNADCFHNRWVGAARGIERAAQAWGEAAPRQAAAATGALENAEEVTGELARKPPLWLRVVKYAKWLWPPLW